jgi:hypothetical protein
MTEFDRLSFGSDNDLCIHDNDNDIGRLFGRRDVDVAVWCLIQSAGRSRMS